MSLSYLRSILITDPLIVLATIIMGTVSMIASLFDKTGRTQHSVARGWARMLLAVSGVKVEISGAEKLDLEAPYVLAANHQSLMDTPLIIAHVPLEFRFFAKEGLFHIPFLGTHLRRAGHFPVVRGNARASLKVLTDAARVIRERRLSVLLFPEGGRSPLGMRAFKEGAAHLAIKAEVPLVPVGIRGTREVLPMGSFHIRPQTVRLRIGDPIPTVGLTPHDRGALSRQVEQQVAELSDQSPAPAAVSEPM